MQLVVLAYVSTGSFISHTGDPCLTFPGRRDGAEKAIVGSPMCRVRVPEKMDIKMVSVYSLSEYNDPKLSWRGCQVAIKPDSLNH